MASYQDIETRLAAVERKLDYVMNNFTLSRVNPLTRQPEVKTMLDIYHEAQQVEAFNAKEVKRAIRKVIRTGDIIISGQEGETLADGGPQVGSGGENIGENLQD